MCSRPNDPAGKAPGGPKRQARSARHGVTRSAEERRARRVRTTLRRPSVKGASSVPYACLLVARISRFRLAQAEALYSRDRRGLGRCPRPRSCVSIVRGVVGMEITHKQRPRLRALSAQFLLGIAGVALITFVCFKIGFGVGRTSLAYLIWIAPVSLLGSFGVSVVLSSSPSPA
jgi:hypothetical protein